MCVGESEARAGCCCGWEAGCKGPAPPRPGPAPGAGVCAQRAGNRAQSLARSSRRPAPASGGTSPRGGTVRPARLRRPSVTPSKIWPGCWLPELYENPARKPPTPAVLGFAFPGDLEQTQPSALVPGSEQAGSKAGRSTAVVTFASSHLPIPVPLLSSAALFLSGPGAPLCPVLSPR